MNPNESPCRNCGIRTTYCHGECAAYKEWSAARIEQNKRDHEFAAYQFGDLSSQEVKKARRQYKIKRELKK